MLLDIEFTIKVTNDGDNKNNTEIHINPNHKLGEFMTVLQMAQKSVIELSGKYLYEKYGHIPEDEELEGIIEGLTFSEVVG